MYVAGWNMPGYMPETEPEAFETTQEAWEYLLETLDQWDDQPDDTPVERSAMALVSSYADTSEETLGTVYAYNNGLALWVSLAE